MNTQGKLKITKTVTSPWKSHIYIEKFDRGKWNVALFDRKVDDFCKSIQKPTEVWYRFTSRLKHKNCPFNAGEFEQFDNMQVGKLPDFVSFALVGKYRFSFKSFFSNADKTVRKECFRLGFEIMEG